VTSSLPGRISIACQRTVPPLPDIYPHERHNPLPLLASELEHCGFVELRATHPGKVYGCTVCEPRNCYALFAIEQALRSYEDKTCGVLQIVMEPSTKPNRGIVRSFSWASSFSASRRSQPAWNKPSARSEPSSISATKMASTYPVPIVLRRGPTPPRTRFTISIREKK
jgi:hypothetical protein